MRAKSIVLCMMAAAFFSTGCLEVRDVLMAGLSSATLEDGDGDAVEDANTDGVANDETDMESVGPDQPATDADTSGVPPLPEGAKLSSTGTGLEYYDFEVGTGDQPTSTSTVRVKYVGYLEDGTIFDSNDDATFALTGVVEGFSEGISTMRVKSRA